MLHQLKLYYHKNGERMQRNCSYLDASRFITSGIIRIVGTLRILSNPFTTIVVSMVLLLEILDLCTRFKKVSMGKLEITVNV